MRIGYPGMMRAAQMGGLMQGMNQAGDRAMKYDLAQKQMEAEDRRHAAEMALKEMDISQSGKLGGRRLDIDERTANNNFATESARTGIMQQEANQRAQGMQNEDSRFYAGLRQQAAEALAGRTHDSNEARLRREFDDKQGGLGRKHAYSMMDRQAELADQARLAGEDADRRAYGAGGWRREADRADQSALDEARFRRDMEARYRERGWAVEDRDVATGQRALDRGSRNSIAAARMLQSMLASKMKNPQMDKQGNRLPPTISEDELAMIQEILGQEAFGQ